MSHKNIAHPEHRHIPYHQTGARPPDAPDAKHFADGISGHPWRAVITAQVDGATGVVNIGESCSFAAASASGAQATEDMNVLGQGKAVHTATSIAVTRSEFTTITFPTALPTLSDASLHLKGGANGLKVPQHRINFGRYTRTNDNFRGVELPISIPTTVGNFRHIHWIYTVFSIT
ncbi:hypothetical protein B0H19DRAFT_1069423 [Mycena capillaripes]|nr:hypothetical protein B0H19DRAFT_1069423 [Mycena capillaripes]